MNQWPKVSSLPIIGRVAVHGGVEYRARGKIGSRDVYLYMDRLRWDAFMSECEISRGSPDDRDLWVFVGRDAISRLFIRRVLATWSDIEVQVTAPLDAESVLLWFNGDPKVAQARGMEGSQYDDWRAVVPFADLSNIRIIEE